MQGYAGLTITHAACSCSRAYVAAAARAKDSGQSNVYNFAISFDQCPLRASAYPTCCPLICFSYIALLFSHVPKGASKMLRATGHALPDVAAHFHIQ